MSEHVVKILEANYITHDVKRFVVERPPGYDFIPGQATDVSLPLPGWKDNLHPFTFTGLTDWNYLEFVIKIYNDRKGITAELGKMNAGSELILHDVFGAIQYNGRGTFIAGGAGITPFIAIFRALNKDNKLYGNRLINSNKTSADIILRAEFETMLKGDFINVLTRENTIGFFGKRIDRDFLVENISEFSGHFYICGPDAFVTDISKLLLSLGAAAETLIVEQ
jgi:ferredoxin-NADP reductase